MQGLLQMKIYYLLYQETKTNKKYWMLIGKENLQQKFQPSILNSCLEIHFSPIQILADRKTDISICAVDSLHTRYIKLFINSDH